MNVGAPIVGVVAMSDTGICCVGEANGWGMHTTYCPTRSPEHVSMLSRRIDATLIIAKEDACRCFGPDHDTKLGWKVGEEVVWWARGHRRALEPLVLEMQQAGTKIVDVRAPGAVLLLRDSVTHNPCDEVKVPPLRFVSGQACRCLEPGMPSTVPHTPEEEPSTDLWHDQKCDRWRATGGKKFDRSMTPAELAEAWLEMYGSSNLAYEKRRAARKELTALFALRK